MAADSIKALIIIPTRMARRYVFEDDLWNAHLHIFLHDDPYKINGSYSDSENEWSENPDAFMEEMYEVLGRIEAGTCTSDDEKKITNDKDGIRNTKEGDDNTVRRETKRKAEVQPGEVSPNPSPTKSRRM